MPYERDSLPPVIAPARFLPQSLAGCAPRSFAGHSFFDDIGDFFAKGWKAFTGLFMPKEATASYTSMLQDQSDDPNAPSPDDQEVAPTDAPPGTNASPSAADAPAAPQAGGGDAGTPDASAPDAGTDDGSGVSSSGAIFVGASFAGGGKKHPAGHRPNTPTHPAIKAALAKAVPGQDKAYGDGWKAGKRGDSPQAVQAVTSTMPRMLARSYRHAWKVAGGRVPHKMPNMAAGSSAGVGPLLMPVMGR